MSLDEITPASVAEGGGTLGRPHDVGEEQRREDAVRLARFSNTREELLDLGDDLVAVNPRNVIFAWQFDVLRAFDVLREPARVADVTHVVPFTVDDECRHVDARDDVADVDLERHPHERHCFRWTRALRL